MWIQVALGPHGLALGFLGSSLRVLILGQILSFGGEEIGPKTSVGTSGPGAAGTRGRPPRSSILTPSSLCVSTVFSLPYFHSCDSSSMLLTPTSPPASPSKNMIEKARQSLGQRSPSRAEPWHPGQHTVSVHS